MHLATPKHPLVVIVAGPNGAGKSTTAPEFLSRAVHVQEFVNADAIALGLSGLRPETVAFAAGRVMLARLKVLAGQRADFAFEATLASRTFAPWINKLRKSGYRAHLIFLSLPNVDLALERVAERVRLGARGVPGSPGPEPWSAPGYGNETSADGTRTRPRAGSS